MPIFSSEQNPDAHQQFVNWIDANPSGFVINRKARTDMVLHVVSCGHFRPYDSANQTTNLKACSLERIKLEHWAEVEGIDRVQLCNDCF
jgi:hypothetical protein